MSSATLTVSNTPPTAPVVTIEQSGGLLFCEVTTASTDADDAISTPCRGRSMARSTRPAVPPTPSPDTGSSGWIGPSTTVYTNDTVDGADVSAGDVWACIAVPNDGSEDGPEGSDEVTISECEMNIALSMGPGGPHLRVEPIAAFDAVRIHGLVHESSQGHQVLSRRRCHVRGRLRDAGE